MDETRKKVRKEVVIVGIKTKKNDVLNDYDKLLQKYLKTHC